MASTIASMPAHRITDVGWQKAALKDESGFRCMHRGLDLRVDLDTATDQNRPPIVHV